MSFGGQTSTRHKIIIGIDYGTTFSGVSYVTTDKSDIKDITIISSWPGEQLTSWKTPTRIAYARENSPLITENKWGFEVSPKLISYSWTKLLLDKNAAMGEYDDPALAEMEGSGMLRLPSFRQAAGVCEDFLHELYRHVSKKLAHEMTELIFESTPMECWITLPAIWSDEAKDATLTAARNAGFGNRVGDEVFTIAEPEAAAIATLKSYSGTNGLNAVKPKENILICDCGGGTVDITTYVITQVSPQLMFDELQIGAGGKCGSTYIDRNLHTLLSRRFGAKYDDLPFAQKGPGSRLMTSFEKHKRDFGLNDNKDVREIGPIRLDVSDSEYFDEDERNVKLTYEDMEALFRPVVSDIENLLRIQRLILVGGFAQSPYLRNSLEEWCLYHGEIAFLCPDQPQAAILRGAALRGLEGLAPGIKYVRRHYGVGLSMPFREGIDPEHLRYTEYARNEDYCRGRMTWIISKGEKIVYGTSRTTVCKAQYTPGKEKEFEVKLYSCSLIDAPEFRTHARVEQVGTIKGRLPANFDYGHHATTVFNTKLGRDVHEFSVEIEVVFGGRGNNLTFKNLVGGKVISTADIEFDKR
ncbi:Hsp70 family protein-like protein [Hyaloscypha variabilis F]|uniref:Hsp70 family protein-like protein n=1 Tax=Hyaloscypha variabilis (strain UAMH 11265 / GT02V1 / F) TaxID=1149755 RepID=A0A2J6R7P0_HYAVF|nr:Hsp70 family protein-like protein [Hyaloscypha variabilis F]